MKKLSKILGFVALSIAMFVGTLDTTITNIALPDITTYFKASLSDTSWISTIYVLSLSVFMISASKIADQFGRKKVMLVGLIIFGASSAMCGLSTSLLFLIVMRGIQGIGGAIITPIVVPMCLELFGKEKTQLVAGMIGATTALAAAGGPPIGGILIEYMNWQSIFFVNIPLTIISVILTIFFVKESYDKTASKDIDWIGMILLSSTLFFLTFALLKGNDYGWTSVAIISMFIVSMVSLILLIFAESKIENPMLELSLFRESTFTASSTCYLITGFAITAPELIFNYFLQNALGYTALNAAFIVTAMALTVIVSMPLGTVLTKKIGARIINFIGILVMGIGCLLLSNLTMDVSKTSMIIYMIVCGFGLGFSAQALVSSIKHIPEEKSGVGSGIVNAARQVGSCIGIAILVSMLDANVTTAKNDIKSTSIAAIKSNKGIDNSIKQVMIKDINDSFSGGESGSTTQNDLKSKLEKDIKKELSSSTKTIRPTNDSTLEKLYDSTKSLDTGIGKLADGQKQLNTSIGSLDSGVGSLVDGNTSITSNLGTLDNGISKTLDGSKQLSTSSSQGINELSDGANSLNSGAQKMLGQFSSSKDSSNPTIYDGITGINSGNSQLSTNVGSYTQAVNSTLYQIIKNDPSSAQLLNNYKSSFEKVKTQYESTTKEDEKAQYLNQMQMLSNIISIYTAAEDPDVTNVNQFTSELANSSNKNVVSSGEDLKAGSVKLAAASQKVASQFNDGGNFKSGMVSLANGTNSLVQGTNKLNSLQTGMNKLTDSISQLKAGSAKLANGFKQLGDGLSKTKDGTYKLSKGSEEIVSSTQKLKDGSSKIVNGIGLAGQKNQIEEITNNLSSDKDDKITDAFNKTFFFSAIILILTSVCGFFTDKKTESNAK